MYELQIITNNHLKKIRNPIKARDRDLIVRSIVEVMDGNGKWHLVGHCFYPTDASWAADDINEAIKRHKTSICLDI